VARPFDIENTVRSYELDTLGHTNNAVYVNWMEQARLATFQELGFGIDGLLAGTVLYNIVRAEVSFRRPTFFGDRVIIGTLLESIGTSSVKLQHPMTMAEDGALVCESREVIVWLGSDGRPTPVPDDVREALGRLDKAEEGDA
jgi:acyl-CoA thioester hydrolase